MRSIGIFGGTFDPVHFGHINLAQEILEKRNLDQVWFIPAWASPFKTEKKQTDPYHRLKMLELALSDTPQFKVLDCEIKREAPSYTVDTLRELHSKEKSCDFHLIISDETAKDFFKWKEPEEIMRLAPLIVGTRNGASVQGIKEGVTPIRRMDISSTEVRERLRLGLNCNHLVPQKVLDYIYKNRLYFGA